MDADGASFDYIIVGAGSAGCVLANRLSQDPRATVCLIEAGRSDRSLATRLKVNLPAGNTILLSSPTYNWSYVYAGAEGMHHGAIPAHRGRVSGGSSAVNGMVYMRGQKRDYDRWAAQGNRGWAYDDVLPDFKAQENREAGADDFHGTGGELNVAKLRWLNPLTQAFLAAAGETQHPSNPDFNGARQDGFGPHEVTQRNGERWSSRARLPPSRARPPQPHRAARCADPPRAAREQARRGRARAERRGRARSRRAPRGHPRRWHLQFAARAAAQSGSARARRCGAPASR